MWAARDDSGRLFLHQRKPIKLPPPFCIWAEELAPKKDMAWEIDRNMFPNIKWEDKEPTEVELVIKEK